MQNYRYHLLSLSMHMWLYNLHAALRPGDPHPSGGVRVLSVGPLNSGFRTYILFLCSLSKITVLGKSAINRNLGEKTISFRSVSMTTYSKTI